MEQALDPLCLGLVPRSLPRPMRRVEMQADEKRPAGFREPVDDFNGPAAQQVRQISGLLNFRVAIPQVFGPVRRFVREIIERAAAEAVKMVVSALQRPETGQPAQM